MAEAMERCAVCDRDGCTEKVFATGKAMAEAAELVRQTPPGNRGTPERDHYNDLYEAWQEATFAWQRTQSDCARNALDWRAETLRLRGELAALTVEREKVVH